MQGPVRYKYKIYKLVKYFITNLFLLVAPKITVPPENQTVKNGESILFECQATGALPPQIWWKKNGRPLAQTSRIFFVNDNKELHIEHAKESDSGERSSFILKVKIFNNSLYLYY